MTLDQKTKQEIYDVVFDMLIMDSKVQGKLFTEEPIIITVEGMPVSVSIYHTMSESIVCLSKQSKLLGLYIPTSNRLKALRFVIRAIYRGKFIDRHKTSWLKVYDFLNKSLSS